MSYVRVFDNTFWGDEAYTIRLSQMNFLEMVRNTANDVHPPLYYLCVQMICKIFGHNNISYHLASIIPYGLLMIFSLRTIKKNFGTEASMIMMTMISIMDNAIVYNLEARMYSLGAMFLVFSFWEFYQILEKNNAKHYILFVLYSLGAAYTHYYCLISVSFFYIVLIGFSFYKKKEYFIRVLISCCITVLGYLPWFVVLLNTFKRASNGWWSTQIPGFHESINYIFINKYNKYLLALFIGCIIATLVSDYVHITEEGSGQKQIRLRKDAYVTKYSIWMLTGVLSIAGTMLVGIAISDLIRPLFLLRYLYPVSVVAWLMLSISACRWQRKKISKISCILIIMLVVLGSMSQYKNTIVVERNMNERLEHTLSMTLENISEDALIMSNDSHFCWTILEYYYPKQNYQMLDFNIIDSGMAEEYWLILTYELDKGNIDELIRKGYSCQEYVNNGIIGTSEVYIYKVDTKKSK